MKRLFLRLLTVLGAVTLFVFLIFFIVNIVMLVKKPKVAEKTILELNLDREFVEYIPDESVAMTVFEDKPRLLDVLEAVERASKDERVKALVAKVGGAEMGLATIQEFRDSVAAFRKTGKKAYAFADTFGEFGPGVGAYYLASAFDKIFVQPSGSVCITGFMAETPFLRGFLDKVGVAPRFDSREEYKNAVNTFTKTHYTQPHEEALNALYASFSDGVIRDVSEARGIEEEKVRSLLDRGIFSAVEAVEANLVDQLFYADEFSEYLEKEIGPDSERLAWPIYLERAGSPHSNGDTVALIYGVGVVQRGQSGFSPMFGDAVMGSESVSSAFRQALEDESVSAIIFRINSPGGSYVASDTIWRETIRAKEKGVPVIASMGDVAGSGGYFVAMAADQIVSQPGAVTGSIGVFAGKMITSEFWNKLGVSWDGIKTSRNASFWSGKHDYTPEQWEIFQSWLDRIYEDFTLKAAESRGLSREEMLDVAKGRIWSGRDAWELGLVDELGGYGKAIQLAKREAGIAEDENITLKEFPARKSILEKLLENLPGYGLNMFGTEIIARTIQASRSTMKIFSDFGITKNPGVLSMPPLDRPTP